MEEDDGAQDGPNRGKDGEPSNAAADFMELRVPSSWDPPDLMELSRNEPVARVCELEHNLCKMREEFVNAENDRRFTIETVSEVLRGMEEKEQAYQSLFSRVRCLERMMVRNAPVHLSNTALSLLFFFCMYSGSGAAFSFCKGIQGPRDPLF